MIKHMNLQKRLIKKVKLITKQNLIYKYQLT